MPKSGIHGARSTNCIAGVVRSNATYSDSENRNVSIDVHSAIRRAMFGALSPATMNSQTAPRMGVQMVRLRIGASCIGNVLAR